MGVNVRRILPSFIMIGITVYVVGRRLDAYVIKIPDMCQVHKLS